MAGPIDRASRWLSLYGPLLLALYFLATTRWGSFALPGPPYVGDVLLAGLILQRVWTLAVRGRPTPLLARATAIPAVLLLAFSAAALALGELSETSLRDGAPYFYAVLVLFGQDYGRIPEKVALGLTYGALILHAAWYTIADAFPSVIDVPTLGDSSVLFLSIRSDIDGAFIAVLAALSLDRTIRGRTPLLSASLAGWAMVLVLLNFSRASMLATVALLLVVVVRFVVLRRRGARIAPDGVGGGMLARQPLLNPALAVLVVIAAPIGITAAGGTPLAVERSLNATAVITEPTKGEEGGGGGGRSESGGDQGSGGKGSGRKKGGRDEEVQELPADGYGTASARKDAWGEVLEWLVDGGPSRVALGVGFGPHYMQLSGADNAFQGDYPDPTVRAVHNYGINTWARLGLVGLGLLLAVNVLGLVAALTLLTRALELPILDLLAAMLVVAIPVVALLGVVLESPFGAIPYFWAIGYLSARMVQEGRWRSLPIPGLPLARRDAGPAA